MATEGITIRGWWICKLPIGGVFVNVKALKIKEAVKTVWKSISHKDKDIIVTNGQPYIIISDNPRLYKKQPKDSWGFTAITQRHTMIALRKGWVFGPWSHKREL